MKKYTWIIIGLLGLLVLAVVSYLWATNLIGSIMGYRSPLQHNPPPIGQSLGKPVTRRVVVVLIDAERLDTSLDKSVMPFLNELRSQGAYAIMHSQPPSFSEPGYTTLLTGAWPEINDGPQINLDYADIPTFTQDDIFSAAHRAGLRTGISGYYWFEKLVPQASVDDHFYTPGEDAAADVEVMNAIPAMIQNNDNLILIHLDQVDYAGHHLGGPLQPAWAEASKKCDDYLRQIAGMLDLKQDTLIVLSDHGQINQGGHGGPEPITLIEPFVMVGPNVVRGEHPDMRQIDVSPTIAALLGTAIPSTAEGSPLMEMLTLPAEYQAKIQSSELAQKQELYKDYSNAIKSSAAMLPEDSNNPAAYVSAMASARAKKLAPERIWRSIMAVLLALIPLALMIRSKDRRLPWLLLGAVITMGLFHLRYAVFDHLTYSLSSVKSQTWLITYGAITSAVAVIIGWLVAMFGLKTFTKGSRLATSDSLAFLYVTLYLLALPVLLSFALNGALVTWTLPEFYTIFVAFLALLQALFTAVLGLPLTGIIALVARFTRRPAAAR